MKPWFDLAGAITKCCLTTATEARSVRFIDFTLIRIRRKICCLLWRISSTHLHMWQISFWCPEMIRRKRSRHFGVAKVEDISSFRQSGCQEGKKDIRLFQQRHINKKSKYKNDNFACKKSIKILSKLSADLVVTLHKYKYTWFTFHGKDAAFFICENITWNTDSIF